MTKAILFVDHAPAIGGAENSLLMLMHQLAQSTDWQPHLATVEGKLAEAARIANIPVHVMTLPRLRKSPVALRDWCMGARALSIAAKNCDAAAIYSNTIRASFFAALAAKKARKPFVWHMRDFWLGENRPKSLTLDTLLKRLLVASASTVITNSHSVAAKLPPSDKIKVAHNGIEIGRFDPTIDGAVFRKHIGIPEDAEVVGMMGRLRPWKGQMRFLEIAADVIKQKPDTHFAIIGGATFGVQDEFEQQLHKKVSELDLIEQVHFTGHINDTAAALSSLDIFIHPGDPEPFGLVNIEAMAMSKPVVALAHGALPEIVVDGECGFLVHSTDELTEQVLKLLNNPSQRKQLGARGREIAKTQFTIQNTATTIEEILLQCLK